MFYGYAQLIFWDIKLFIFLFVQERHLKSQEFSADHISYGMRPTFNFLIYQSPAAPNWEWHSPVKWSYYQKIHVFGDREWKVRVKNFVEFQVNICLAFWEILLIKSFTDRLGPQKNNTTVEIMNFISTSKSLISISRIDS